MLNIKNFTYFFITIFLLLLTILITNLNLNLPIKILIKEIDSFINGDVSIALEEEIDYSIFSNDMICDKVPNIDFYPELKGFQDEANRRGIKCYYMTVGHYSTNKPEGFISEIPLPISKP